MSKLIMGLLVFMLGMCFMSSFMTGSNTWTSHTLEAAVTTSSTTIVLDSTQDVTAGMVIWLDNEQVQVGSVSGNACINCTRAVGNSTAATHAVGDTVYSQSSEGINGALNAKIVALSNASGPFKILDISAILFELLVLFLVSPIGFMTSGLWIISALYFVVVIGLLMSIGIQMFSGRASAGI